MENIYYNSTRVEILKRLRYLNERKYVDFFRESAPFMLSIYLAYFGLAEDIMIERDSKNYNINTRFTKHIDDKYLNMLFPDDIPIDFIKKESNGNSMEWVLSTLRNGIFHNGPVVDYKEKTIKVFNEGFLNNLECNIPFSWFENFMNENIVEHLQLDNYTYHVFDSPFTLPKDYTIINTYDDINDFIDSNLHGIVINIAVDDNVENPVKLERPEFIEFTNSISNRLYNFYYIDEENVDEELEELKKKIESLLTNEKLTLSEDKYKKLVYFNMFKELYEQQFKNKYSDYNVSISEFENKQYAESLFKRGRDRIKFFKHEKPVFQGREIANRLKDLLNHDKVEYLSKIHYLYSLYDFCSHEVTKEFQTDKFMEKILNDKYRTNAKLIEEKYAQVIKEELEKNGIVLTYDRQITDTIIWGMNIYDDDIHLRCRELTSNYNGDVTSEDYKNYIKNDLKANFSTYYDEQTEIYINRGVYADQVWDIYNSHNLYAINNAKGVLKENRDDVIEALLYTLGINTYVMNKETHFKELTEEDYSFMDSEYFKGYSHDLYKDDIAVTKQKRSELKKKEKRITKSLNGLQIGIAKTIDKEELKKKKNEIIAQTNDLKIITSEISNYDLIINNTEVIDMGDKKLQKAPNALCATIIRNCFAHCDRIHITGRDETGETLITLTDYDNNSEISGIVETNLTSLINFLSHDIFQKEMNKGNEANKEKYQKI